MCNKDCFNCPFPDCVEDELSSSEFKSDEADQFLEEKESKRVIKNREASKLRMRRIRVEKPNLAKEYYLANREQELKRNAIWQKDNKEYKNAYQRERYAKNREEMCRKQREYRMRKKREKEALHEITYN